MTTKLGARPVRGTGGRGDARHGRRRGLPTAWLTAWTIRRAIVCLIALAGLGVLLYPSTANWWHDRAHHSQIDAYSRSVAAKTPAQIKREWERAVEFNAKLPDGPIGDPSGQAGGSVLSGALAREYGETLDVGPNGMMGTVSVPSVGINLPIYHGTSDQTLDTGAGHLEGTALPVGGPGTHSVLTGHSGIPGNDLFTGLHQARIGQLFTVTVLDRTLTYRIMRIATVLPTQTDSLRPVPGKDYLTLVTCTPIGVNSHRLLVTGVRVPDRKAAAQALAVPTDGGGPGVPWWALIFTGALLVILLLTAPMARRRTTTADAPADFPAEEEQP